jgi:hypothetical protein
MALSRLVRDHARAVEFSGWNARRLPEVLFHVNDLRAELMLVVEVEATGRISEA